MAHTFYQPTDYEQMMIAAGWMTAADVDPDYALYLKTAPGYGDDAAANYERWQGMKREWDTLNASYEAEIETYAKVHLFETLPADLNQRANELLKQMIELEYLLGY